MAKPKHQKTIGSDLNRLHQDLQRQERDNSNIIRLRATVGRPVSKFTKRLTGRAKGKQRKIVAQFELLVTETWRLIPEPKSWGLFSEWVHHHRLVGALRGMDLQGKDAEPPTDWLPDHPLVLAAKRGQVRGLDGIPFFEPYPVRDGVVTIARYDEVTKMDVSILETYLPTLEDVKLQLAMELNSTRGSSIRTRSSAKVVEAALPFAPPQVIKRKKPEKIQWRDTTKIAVLPKDADLDNYRVICITICKDGSMCHHVRVPEVCHGTQRVQQERTLTCKPGLPVMAKQPEKVLKWMQVQFAGLDTAEQPIFPGDYQGSYAAYMASPLGVATCILHRGPEEETPMLDGVVKPQVRKLPPPQVEEEDVPDPLAKSPMMTALEGYQAPEDPGFKEESPEPVPAGVESDEDSPDWKF